MVVKVYISGISGNKEVKKRQQRVLMILDSKNIKYDVIDITEPGRESDKEFMQSNAKSCGGTVSDPAPRSALPPQVFNDDEYCGDYDQFDMANEIDTLEQFLKVEIPPEEPPQAENGLAENALNGNGASEKLDEAKSSKENSQERDAAGDKTSKEASVEKESTPARESTPAKEDTPAKETTPEKQLSKEGTPAKETSEAEHEKSPSPAQDAKASKEPSPDIDEPANGAVSSREHSVEKAQVEEPVERTKDDPSEALIDSEKAVASE
ncbi:unnamed protein product [Plutella xylostella]|uniref:(diamondback moth) hypothetical protein n=1 Tax=Plutella xylostella TaxID=51655 RepID=A0A8S4EKY5_PLUXY|nr:unnamed protein product [Plutella xylostella]